MEDSLKKIVLAAIKGWHQAGEQGWRKEFVDKGINPDEFLKLPGAENLLAQYEALESQQKIVFLNTLYRRYVFLRLG